MNDIKKNVEKSQKEKCQKFHFFSWQFNLFSKKNQKKSEKTFLWKGDLWRLVFDQSSPVHPVLESKGVTYTGGAESGQDSFFLILDNLKNTKITKKSSKKILSQKVLESEKFTKNQKTQWKATQIPKNQKDVEKSLKNYIYFFFFFPMRLVFEPALQSTPFQKPRGVPWAWRTQEEQEQDKIPSL